MEKLGNSVAQSIRISGYYHLVAIIVHYFIVCSMYSNDRDDNECFVCEFIESNKFRTHFAKLNKNPAIKSVQHITCANHAIPILKWNLVESLFCETLEVWAGFCWMVATKNRVCDEMNGTQWNSVLFSRRENKHQSSEKQGQAKLIETGACVCVSVRVFIEWIVRFMEINIQLVNIYPSILS